MRRVCRGRCAACLYLPCPVMLVRRDYAACRKISRTLYIERMWEFFKDASLNLEIFLRIQNAIPF